MKDSEATKALKSVEDISSTELSAKLTELRQVEQNLQSSARIVSFQEYKRIREAIMALEVILKVRYGLPLSEAIKDNAQLILHRRQESRRRGKERAKRGLRMVRQ